jgi:hypothetical protein
MLGIYSLGKLSLKYKISLSFKDTTRKKLIRNVIRVIQLKFILLSLMGGKNGN